jgi:selenocysteine lyase/cysteine desulfurase
MEFDLQEYKSAWNLDQDVRHCNHGSFGAVPIVVQEAQKKIQDRVQSNPVKFFARQAMSEVQDARSKVAAFLGQKPEQIVFDPFKRIKAPGEVVKSATPIKANDWWKKFDLLPKP